MEKFKSYPGLFHVTVQHLFWHQSWDMVKNGFSVSGALSVHKATTCLQERGSYAQEQFDNITVNHSGHYKWSGIVEKWRCTVYRTWPSSCTCVAVMSFLLWFFRFYWKGEIQDSSEILMVSSLRKSFWDQRVLNRHVEAQRRAVRWDVIVVAAGENKDLQDPASHRLCEVRFCFM